MGVQGQGTAAEPRWTREDFTVTSWDETKLAASVWIPKDATPVPAILITNGWNNRHDRAIELRFAERYANQGYVVLAWTSRGWGNSEGEIELDGPAEQNDTKTMIDLLAAKSDEWHVQMDSTCPAALADLHCQMAQPSKINPRLGMVGESYAGGIQFLTAQGDSRIDSIIPRITWSNLLDSLAPNDVLKVGWITELYGTGQTVSRGAPVPDQQPGDEPDAEGPSDDLTRWYTESAAANEPTDEMRHEVGWVRSLHPGKLNTPTMLIQGWGDTLFTPNEALATYEELRSRNVTVRLVFYPGGHGQSLAADAAASVFVDQQMDEWLNVTLRGRAPTLPPYPVIRYRDFEADFVGELQWPPANTTVWRGYFGADLSLGDAPTEASVDLINPVLPTNCVDVPSFQSQVGANCPYSVERTSAIWAGAPLHADTEVTGTPVAHLVLGSTQLSDVRVFVTLEDIAPDGTVQAVWRQTMPMRLGQSTGQEVNVTMQTTTHTFPKGHRIGLQVATTDLSFHASREPGTITVMSSPTQPSWLDVPVVPKDGWGDRTPPTITLRNVTKGGTCTESIPSQCDTLYLAEFSVMDDLALSNVTVTPGIPQKRASDKVATVHVDAQPGVSVVVSATDTLGNTANLIWRAPAPEITQATCAQAECPGNGAPGVGSFVGIVAVGLVALVARRRSLRQ